MKLNIKIALFILSVAVVTIVILSTVSVKTIRTELQNEISEKLSADAFHVMEALDRFFFERLSDIKVMTSRENIMLFSDEFNINEKIDYLRRIEREKKVYASMSIYDANGIKIGDTRGIGVGNDESDKPFFQESIKGNIYSDIKPIFLESLGIPVIHFSGPLMDENGKIKGVLVTRFSASNIEDIVSVKAYESEKAVTVDLLDKDGLVLFSNHQRMAILRHELSGLDIFKKVAKSEEGMETLISMHEGKEVFFIGVKERGYLDYKGNDWICIMGLDTDIALAPVRQLIRKILIIGFVILLLIIPLSFFISQSITKPITALIYAIKKVAQGNLNYKSRIRSKDEIGQLSRAFDGMTEDLKNSTTSITKLNKEISKRKKTEEKIIQNQMFLDSIVENIPIFVILKDAKNLRFILINKSGENLLGYKKKDLIGRNDYDFFPKQQADFFINIDREVLRTGKLKDIPEEPINTKQGERIVHTKKIPIYDEKGNAQYLLGISEDITERKLAEETLKKAKEESELANQAKSDFLANMSHEIRTPMNAVIGFTDMILDTNLNKEQTDYLVMIKKSGEALLSLINDILDFSKIEAGELDFEKIDFDPELLAYDICELIHPRIELKPIEILCRIGENLPSNIRGDPARFRQVLTNLMGNASKFTKSGEVELSLDIEEEEDNRVKLHAKVRDTGIGIPKCKLATIFDPFQQADGSTTRKYGGTGLGLSICRQISNLMSGDVWAESEVNKGSTFHFTAWFGKTLEKKALRFAPVSFSGKRVLIVDDNQTNLDILKHTLELTGMEVTALSKSKDVLPALQKSLEAKTPFDLCIIDLQMPGMSGYDIAEKVRDSKYKFKDIHLIALSSLMERDARRCEQAGVDGFLSKPIHRKKLFQMVERILGEREGRVEKKKAVQEKIITQYSIREDMKHSARILLAEDNPVNQKLAKMMLTKAGYQVEVADNGREAVEKYTKNPDDFDLIFMDVQMPEMDGMEATKAIKEKGFDTIPIVAMTAHAMRGDRERCLDAGMDDYITKPIKRELVFDMLEKWVFKKESLVK